MSKYPKEYGKIHDWLHKTYGKPVHCDNPNCKVENVKRYEYALKKGCEYEFNRDNFIIMCKSCHVRYDMTREWFENMVETRIERDNYHHTPESCINISNACKGMKMPESQKQKTSRRMIKNNPMKNKEVVEKMQKTKSERVYVVSKERRQHLSDIFKDRILTDEHKRKLKEATIAAHKIRIKCKYCGKEVPRNIYAKCHGDKCKCK
jgi:hypothetical protein